MGAPRAALAYEEGPIVRACGDGPAFHPPHVSDAGGLEESIGRVSRTLERLGDGEGCHAAVRDASEPS